VPRTAEAQKQCQAERYADYKRLCAEAGVAHRGSLWSTHYKMLRSAAGERRLTSAELKCWWTERFTADEIFEMAGALDFLSFERSERVRAA